MSMTQEKSVDVSRKGNAAACQVLLDMASPEMFRMNGFRVTGLTVDAAVREIAKHADKLKMLAELGGGQDAYTGAFALSPPPAAHQIRDALQNLRDPERRIIDELFWFWPEEFGKSNQDPAIQALAAGDRETALEIWLLKETTPTGVAAMHNVAVLWQFVALEWEDYASQQRISEEDQRMLEGYWRDSFKRWDLLVKDDFFWDCIAARAKQLDDPRLTTGFVRRLQNTLPQALEKVNATLAVRYAESGRIDLAQIHVQFMRQTGRSSIAETAELVLGPARTRLKQQMERAQQRAEKDPLDALVATRELLDHAHRAFVLFDLFLGKESHARNDRSDEVANLCNRIILVYHKATDNNQGCHEALKFVLPYAASSDLREQIEKNIRTLQGNATYTRFEPLVNEFAAIENGPGKPKEKLSRIKLRFEAMMVKWQETDNSREALEEVENRLAMILRAISISAHNDHEDLETAIEAIRLASSLAHDAELSKRLAQDKAQISKNKTAAEQHNLLLEIRSDTIEITQEKFRYNSQVLPAADINGVRFGIFTRYTNGAKSSVSYLVGVSSWTQGTVNIECKRVFRNEEKAKADFQAIVQSLCYHIAPGLCSRIAAKIKGGSEISFGDCRLSKMGVHATTGMLAWKRDHLISWSDVRHGTYNGDLQVYSARDHNVKKSFPLRSCWNAVFFKEIAEALNKQRVTI